MPWDVWGRIPKSLRVRIKPVSTKLMHVRMIPGTDELATSTYNDEYTPLSIPRQHLRVRWMDLYIMNIEKNRGPLSSQLILRTARTAGETTVPAPLAFTATTVVNKSASCETQVPRLTNRAGLDGSPNW